MKQLLKKHWIVMLGAALLLLALAVNGMPLIWRLTWRPGWLMFLTLMLFPIAIVLPMALRLGKETKKWRWFSIIALVLLSAFYIGRTGWGVFVDHKVSDYIHSPNGTHTAVVITGRVGSTVYPMRSPFFVEDKVGNFVWLEAYPEGVAYTWIDENTLEFTSGYTDQLDLDTWETIEIKHIRW